MKKETKGKLILLGLVLLLVVCFLLAMQVSNGNAEVAVMHFYGRCVESTNVSSCYFQNAWKL